MKIILHYFRISVNFRFMELQTTSVEVDPKTHRLLRSALIEGKLLERNFGEWLRAREAEALRNLLKHPKRKTRAGSPE